ncbi:LacI family DNA-binding transcriptional regulator [Brachybacterium sp. MASK1Z-5]|uniref:LacI family DNA-binding transcriptional regulator n=1 Tax=Brachybacterium halotolerans TaxID=2795215 RepID=A0ABS1BEK7_9MICO|nr:LacI family DNA-binding transcriptional regulator [Brachybacterium halotolerans]MBK0333026.1 LacI family DNA-binding transcriptional regulator [Brachybacterium halotolerans]
MAIRRVTMEDLARELGTSKTTISRALTDRPGVSESTRAAVVELARARGWRPNATARSLSKAQAGALGWVVRRTEKSATIDPYFMDLLIGAQIELSSTPYSLVLKLVGSVGEELDVFDEWFASRRVDGVLVTDVERDDSRLARLAEAGVPSAVISPRDADLHGATAVPPEDEEGVCAILRHLRGAGSRRIGWVAGPSAFVATQHRRRAIDGWRSQFDALVVESSTLDAESSSRAALRLRREHDLDAVVVDNEFAAIQTIALLHEQGLRVPDDVAVVSWLGSDLCLLSEPTITALEHDVQATGRRWVRALIEAVYGEPIHLDSMTPTVEPVGVASGSATRLRVRGSTLS